MEPLEIRRRPTRQAYRVFAARVALLVGGLAVLVPGFVALVTQPLTQSDRINAAFLVGVGGFATGLGILRLRTGRGLVSRPVVIRLDATGVRVLGGSITSPAFSFLAWPDVAAVEVRPVELDVRLFAFADGGATVLRFVPRADDLIEGEPPDGFTLVKATALGLTPTAASLSLIQGDTSAFRVPLVLDWVRRHQPTVPVEDLRGAGDPTG
ncbi:hypothetical protein [Nocardioides ungokensis]|uniref:hypothetical protein n=1 Tax=Nocardioides ungokensis TaxID=1643322 RepID=UPI0015E009E1|nr:hypothetical protein [Nocardioides ungokensis]